MQQDGENIYKKWHYVVWEKGGRKGKNFCLSLHFLSAYIILTDSRTSFFPTGNVFLWQRKKWPTEVFIFEIYFTRFFDKSYNNSENSGWNLFNRDDFSWQQTPSRSWAIHRVKVSRKQTTGVAAIRALRLRASRAKLRATLLLVVEVTRRHRAWRMDEIALPRRKLRPRGQRMSMELSLLLLVLRRRPLAPLGLEERPMRWCWTSLLPKRLASCTGRRPGPGPLARLLKSGLEKLLASATVLPATPLALTRLKLPMTWLKCEFVNDPLNLRCWRTFCRKNPLRWPNCKRTAWGQRMAPFRAATTAPECRNTCTGSWRPRLPSSTRTVLVSASLSDKSGLCTTDRYTDWRRRSPSGWAAPPSTRKVTWSWVARLEGCRPPPQLPWQPLSKALHCWMRPLVK